MASAEIGADMEIVLRAMEKCIDDRDALPTTSDLVEAVEFSRGRVEKCLGFLESNGDVRTAYDKPELVKIWVPTRMWEGLLDSKRRPGWVEEYGLPEREELEKAIREREQRRNRLRRIEELMYASGRMLEHAIREALKVLEVEELEADFDDMDSWDFSFRLKGVLYITEAKGKAGPADKPDVLQLRGWLDKYLDENPGADPERLCGLVIINHYKDLHPEERWPEDGSNPPLTQYAEQTLAMGKCRKFITTLDLFQVTASVVNDEATPPEARDELESRMRRKVNDDG